MSNKLTKLVESYKAHPEETIKGLQESLACKALTPNDWNISKLFSECFGHQKFEEFRGALSAEAAGYFLKESGGAVTTQAFANINKQFAYSVMMEAYDLPDFEFTKVIPTVPSGNVKSLRVPGVTNIGDEALVVAEGEKYPTAGVSENYIETPEVEKRGVTVPLTREAIFFDRTGLVVDRCRQVGQSLGLNREKRAICAVADVGESNANGKYRYRWGKSTSGFATIATYGDSSGTHNWDNLSASTPLTDYTSIATAWALLKAMTDPFTGEPLFIQPKHIVCGPSLAFKLPFVLNGMVRRSVGGFATSGDLNATEVPNPVNSIVGMLTPIGTQSALYETTASVTTTWFIGDIGKAVKYVEAWPLKIDSMGAGSESDFENDIIMKMKASEMGTYATFEPRAMVKCTA